MPTLYIARHGETVWNTEKKIQGWNDSPLTEKGTLQAECIAERLKDVSIASVYSSPAPRALSTANIAKGERKLEVICDERLREMNFGSWEGLTFEQVKSLYPEKMDLFRNNPHRFVRDDGEDFNQLRSRISALLDELACRCDESILLVTHAIVLKSLISHVSDVPVEEIWKSPPIGSASITILESDSSGFRIKALSDESHLSGLAEQGMTM